MVDVESLGDETAPIQRWVLANLVKTIISKKPPGKCLSSSTPIPELNTLIAKCGDASPVVSSFCCKSLASLALDGHADMQYVLNSLYSVLPTSSNPSALVTTFGEILVWDLQNQLKKKGNYECPYSIRNPVHPYIVILEQKSDSWPVILDKMRHLLVDEQFHSIRSSIIKSVTPVIQTLYFDPEQDAKLSIMRSALWKTMTELAQLSNKSLIDLLLSICSWMQIQTSANVIEVASLLQDLCSLDYEDSSYEKQDMLLVFLLSIFERAVFHNLGVSSILSMAEKLSMNLKQMPQSLWGEVSICMISALISEVPGDCLHRLLMTARNLLSRGGCQVIMSLLIPPCLQLISAPVDVIGSLSDEAKIKKSAKSVLARLERHMKENSFQMVRSDGSLEFQQHQLTVFTPLVYQAVVTVHFAYDLEKLNSAERLQAYVDHISKHYQGGGTFATLFTNLMSSMLICYVDSASDMQMLSDLLQKAAESEKCKSTTFLSVLLYKLVTEPYPDLKLSLLECISQASSHKFSVAVTINTLQLLSESVDLKPLAIRLMVMLWKKHDRSFASLYKLLADGDKGSTSNTTGINELLLAKAAALNEICKLSPDKYGADALKPLSAVIDEAKDEGNSAAAALALKGITILCRSQVVDVRSTWEALKKRLLKDSRPSIVQGLFELLSLVPSQPQTPENEKFTASIRSMLWKCVGSESNPVIIGAAYHALAAFHYKDHTLKILPEVAKQNLQLPASKAATPFEMAKKPEDVLTYTPGSCFITLLKSLNHPDAIKGYTYFLSSLVKQEVVDLPRGVYFSAMNMKRRPSQNNALSGVQGLLCSQFASHSKPAIQPSLAMGVLLSYEPPCELDREGKPLQRSLVVQGRYYEDILKELIQNVPLDMNEWRRCAVLPHAWASFMKRAFLTCVEGRNAELDMQKNRGVATDDIARKITESWLWVRDRLTEAIKLSSKGKPSALGNAVLAFGGLISAINKFTASLDDTSSIQTSENESSHQDHTTWMATAIETILCAYDLKRHSNNVFSFLLTHLAKPTSPSGSVVRGCAALMLSYLVPYFISKDAENIPRLYYSLSYYLHEEDSPTIQLYYRIALSLLVSALYQENYPDQDYSLQQTLQEMLEPCMEYEGSDLSIGQIVGLTICASKLCRAPAKEAQQFVMTAAGYLKEKLFNEDPSSMNYEVLCVSVTAIITTAVSSTTMGMDKIDELLFWFQANQEDSLQSSGSSMAFGMLVASLLSLGHPKAGELYEISRKSWIPVLGNEKYPTLQRLTALKGLCAMYFKGGGLSEADAGSQDSSQSANGLADLVGLMVQLIKSSRDIGLQNACAWSLGEIFSKHCHQSDSTVPSTYSYLKEESVLRYVVDLMMEKINKGIVDSYLETCLQVISQQISRPLPPLNWVPVLSPLLHMSEHPNIVRLAMQTVLNESGPSSAATSLLSAWVGIPNVNNLPSDCRLMLMESLPQIIKTLPAPKVYEFINATIIPALCQEDLITIEGQVAAKSLLKTANTPGLLQDAQDIIFKTLTKVISFPDDIIERLKKLKLFEILCKSLCCLPDDMLKEAIESSKEHNMATVDWVFKMITLKKLPLESLLPFFEEEICNKNRGHFFYGYMECCSSAVAKEVLMIEKQKQWILSLIAQVRMAANKAGMAQTFFGSSSEVALFYLEVLAATVISWSDPKMTCFVYPKDSVLTSLLPYLPGALQLLFSKEAWSQITEKVLSLLLELLDSEKMEEAVKSHISNSFCALRNTKQFRKAEIWKPVVISVTKKIMDTSV